MLRFSVYMTNKWMYRLLFLVSIITMPYIVGFNWTFVAWSAEGTCAILSGFAFRNKAMINCGCWIFGIGLTGFFLWDWVRDIKFAERYYTYKYFIISLESILIAAAYLITRNQNQAEASGALPAWGWFIYFTIVNTWLLFLHLGGELFITSVPRWLYYEFYKVLLMALTSFIFGYWIWRVPLLADSVGRRLQKLFYICGIIPVLWIDISFPVLKYLLRLRGEDIVAAAVFILMNGWMLFVGKEVFMSIAKK